MVSYSNKDPSQVKQMESGLYTETNRQVVRR